jgi:hypothetical protein
MINMKKNPAFSPLEKFSIICLLCTALYLIYSTLPQVFNVLSGQTFEPKDFIIDMTILIIGLCALWGSINLAKKTIIMEHLIDIGFEKEIYNRLVPVLEEIASTQVAFNAMEEKLGTMNQNIERLRKRSIELKIPGSDPAFGIDILAQNASFFRMVLLVNISLMTFIFLLKVWGSYSLIIFTILYIVWWLEITYEYDLWHRSSIWPWVFIPVLIIPFTTFLGAVLYGNDIVIGVMGIGLVIYASAYYTWSKYIAEGTLPFELGEHISVTPSDNKIIAYLFSLKVYLIQNCHTIGKILLTCSVIFMSVLVVQLISVNILNLWWMPRLSLGQFILTGITSITFYLISTRLRHKEEKKRVESL